MARWLKRLLPVLVLAIGLAIATGLIAGRRQVATSVPVVQAPLIRVVRAKRKNVSLSVHAEGTVTPRTEANLVAEVGGRVIEISPSFVAGGFFEAGQWLLRIDPADYEIALQRTQATVARRRSELHLARARLERTRALAGRGVVSKSDLDVQESAAEVAAAAVREARASLAQARRDLERTEIKAPFVGRVRQKRADVGQFLTRGTPVATIYAVDYAEVRLPVPDRDLAYLDVALAYRGEGARDGKAATGPLVTLSARFAGRDYTWQGRIVRTEGEVDPRTRMVRLVARVNDPYARGRNSERPPLGVGMFVQAEIAGRLERDAVVLPRRALRGRNHVLVVDEHDRLWRRPVKILRAEREIVVLRSGVNEGDRVCVSPLEIVSDGMAVRVQLAESAAIVAAGDAGG